MEKNELLQKKLSEAILEGEEEKAAESARALLSEGWKAIDVFEKLIVPTLTELGHRFERLEAYLPDLMMAADTVKVVRKVLDENIADDSEKTKSLGTVVIGTCQGDVHDIGKDMVALMLEVSGFTVYDVGVDASVRTFIEKAEEVDADIIGMSSLLTSSMPYMKDLIEQLKVQGKRDKFAVIVGGGPVTPEWAEEIGADAYGRDSTAAVRICQELSAS
jgi:methylmalonyl-CoA mutase cobalamin-binding domain/chain